MRKLLALAFVLFAFPATAQQQWQTVYEAPKITQAQLVGTPTVTFISNSAASTFSNLQTIAPGIPAGSGTTGTKTFVSKIQTGAFGATSGGHIRITVCAGNSSAVAANVGVCTAGGANAWSCATAATRVTWPGATTGTPNGFTIPALSSLASDDITYNLAGGTPLTVAFDGVSLTSTNVPKINTTPATTTPSVTNTGCGGASCFQTYRSAAGIQQAMSTTTARDSSFGSNLVANAIFYVCKVEVRP